MAGSGEYYTLAELSKSQSGAMAKATYKTIIQNVDLFQVIPFELNDDLTYDWEVDQALDIVGTRQINEDWVSHRPTTKTQTERAAIFGGEVEMDTALLHGKSSKDKGKLKSKAYRLFARGLAFKVTETILEGDIMVDDEVFDGLRSRAENTSATDQNKLITTGGGALTLAAVNDLGARVINGGDCFLYNRFNQVQMLNLAQNVSGTALIEWNQTEFGKPIMMYAGKKILVIERQDNGSSYLGFDENPGDGTADTASIYLARIGEGFVYGFMTGTKSAAMDIKDFGELQAGPRVMGRMQAILGLVVAQPRAFARLHGVTKG